MPMHPRPKRTAGLADPQTGSFLDCIGLWDRVDLSLASFWMNRIYVKPHDDLNFIPGRCFGLRIRGGVGVE
jgi:hypothetical protein